jgi:alkylhydroperoxidase family enzyme
MEQMAGKAKGLWSKLSAWLPGKQPGMDIPPPRYPPPRFDGPYADLVRSLEGSPSAAFLESLLKDAFASPILPRRTLSLIFAVVARTLQCDLCEQKASELLDVEGFARADLAEVLETLTSPQLTEAEALLIPWARDTVWMPEQPARIQSRTRPLVAALGPEVVVEAVGATALANSSVRLTMLQV